MSELKTKEANYGNWVSSKLLFVLGFVAFLLLGFSVVFLVFLDLYFAFLVSVVGGLAFVLTVVYFAYARYEFSPRGGNVQAQIQELVLDRLKWDGKGQALDIGCGKGTLSIKLAKKFIDAQVIGVDYWGGLWEYSKIVCETNAEIAGVRGRMNFKKASASALPFEDGFFDATISNLVFHEVSDAKNKQDVIKEALRILKKGGSFSFQDLFLAKKTYGEVADLLETIRSWGVENVQFLDTSHSGFIPKALRLPFMVGTIGVLYGTK